MNIKNEINNMISAIQSIAKKSYSHLNSKDQKYLLDNVSLSIRDCLSDVNEEELIERLEYIRDDDVVVRTIDSLYESKPDLQLAEDDHLDLMSQISDYLDECIERLQG